MKKLISLLMFMCIVFSSFAALASGTTEAAAPVIAEVESGKVMGFSYNGISIFKGIPYAQAERFEMPEPFEPWQDIRGALTFSEVCPQHAYSVNSSDWVSVSNYFVEDRAENDFLTVNIWTQNMEPETLRPVIFWIHGGGYSSGSSMELEVYDGYNLVEYGDVVFVSVNHRLNYLGYMDLSAYGEDYKYTANLGHADLIAALEWVQRNIEKFGGDPKNVTIEGQSGGGTKVTQLMGMPAAKDLFVKAVSQSGGSAAITRTTEQAQADTAKLVEYLGLSNRSNEYIMSYLKTMPYDDLYTAARNAGTSFGATVDGDFYPTGTYEISKDKPYMVGSVLGEFGTNGGNMLGRQYPKFVTEELLAMNYLKDITEEDALARITEMYGDKAEEVIAAYQKAYPTHEFKDLLFTASRRNTLAETMASYGGTAYQYVQAYNPPYFGGSTASHTAGCIPYFFRTIINTDPYYMIAGDEEAAYQVMDDMSTALINFAYTGNPSQSGLEWPAFSVENGETMIFDRTSEVRNYHDKEYMDLIAQINAAK